MWWTRPNPKHSTRSCSSYAKAFLMSSIISLDHEIVQLPDTVGVRWVCQTSQHNCVTIKVHYRYLRKCLLGWHESRLGFVTPYDGEVSLGPLWRATERVKRLTGNEIEQGIGIPIVKSWASIIPVDKGDCIRDWLYPWHRGSSDEIIVEQVGATMGIQTPLMVIGQRGVSVMSVCLPNP